MGWIKRRINKEHSKFQGKLDWSESAERKILSRIKDIIENFTKECDVDERGIVFNFIDTDLDDLKKELGI